MYRAHRGTSGGDSLSDARWYRVTGQAGSRLLSEPPNPDVSGTFACAYHDGWLRTQHPHPNAPLADAVVCFTVALPTPHPPAPPSTLSILPAPSYGCLSAPAANPAPLFPSPAPQLASHLNLTAAPHSCTSACISLAPHQHLTCISPASHAPHLYPSPHSCPSPDCAADGRLSQHARSGQGGNRLVRPAGSSDEG